MEWLLNADIDVKHPNKTAITSTFMKMRGRTAKPIRSDCIGLAEEATFLGCKRAQRFPFSFNNCTDKRWIIYAQMHAKTQMKRPNRHEHDPATSHILDLIALLTNENPKTVSHNFSHIRSKQCNFNFSSFLFFLIFIIFQMNYMIHSKQ